MREVKYANPRPARTPGLRKRKSPLWRLSRRARPRRIRRKMSLKLRKQILGTDHEIVVTHGQFFDRRIFFLG